MQRGLGSCIMELKKMTNAKDLQKFQPLVLWACDRDIAFDAQCEGSRGAYLYELIKLFPDCTPFLDTVERRLFRSIRSTGWEFAQSCDILVHFAFDGNKRAFSILEKCYQDLFGILLRKRKRTEYGLLPEGDNFTYLCVSLVRVCNRDKVETVEYFKTIVNDMGTLIQNNSLYSAFSFYWFQLASEEKLGKKSIYRLLHQASASEAIKAYTFSLEEWIADNSKIVAEHKKNMPASAEELYDRLKNGNEIERRLPMNLMRKLMAQNPQEIEKLAKYYKNEQDTKVRKMLLRQLKNESCVWALDVLQLIADTKSDDETLASYAFDALSHKRDVLVRNYAYELLQNGIHFFEAVSMLAENYEEEDYDFFVNTVKQIPITFDESTKWHWIFMDVMHMIKYSPVKRTPKELLYYMYRNTFCSSCRAEIVKELGRRHMLTQELLEELQYDCNEDIRNYAYKKLEKRSFSKMAQKGINMKRKEIAKETVDILEKGYYISPTGKKVDISKMHQDSVQASKLITPQEGAAMLENRHFDADAGKKKAKISLKNQPVTAAILELKKQGAVSLGVLNFASAKNPGGGFLNGAMAQEESLAASGGLYDTLCAHPEYYEENRKNRSMMYLDYAIFSPDVVFFRDERFDLLEEPQITSVLTLPAVNMGQVILKKEDVSQAKNVMRHRMELCMEIFRQEKVRQIILGAYGCGVFRNSPTEVANWWSELLDSGYDKEFDVIHFAVLDHSEQQECYKAFRCFQS